MFLFLTLALSIPLYLDPSAPIQDRVQDLMDQMTDEERIGQLQQIDGHSDITEPYKTQHCGSMFSMLNSDAAVAVQLARESRLKIPILLAIDAIHGNCFYRGATVFPTQLGVAGSWDTEVMEQMANVTAFEMRYTGPAWTFSPVLCISRDPRWGRVGETFGEDPYTIGKFAAAMIKGYQGEGGVSNNPDKVLACAKHFVGYSESVGGRDASESDLSERKLRSYFLPAFKEAIDANVGSFMSGYQAVEGLPMTINKHLLVDVLREEFGYKGFTVTDYSNVQYMIHNQKVFDNFEDASAAAINNGNDMSMAQPEFYQGAVDAVNSGKLDMKVVNESCRKILEMKFKLGLFEDDRMPDTEKAKARIGTKEHRDVALRAAQESLILLKNDGILPLNENSIKQIAVIGPNADNPLSQNGDWSLGTGQIDTFGNHPRNCTITYLDGIKDRFKNGKVVYEKGCGIEPGEKGNLEKAIQYIEESDISIVVIGDRLIYYGEMRSTGTLELMGGQKELLQAIKNTGKKFILVILSYKPQVIPEDILEAASAVIQQFSPGMLGGQAFAEAIFGDINPSGRLTISIPRHAGQLPVYYNKVRFAHQVNYADLSAKPQYAFGYGLGYSEISYVNAQLDKDTYTTDETIKVTVTLKNEGQYDAVEVVQLYLHDKFTSVTWAEQELKGYERVLIKAGETKTIELNLKASDCSIVNAKGERVVEPGDFELRVSKSSDNPIHKLSFAIKN
ncbi:glycosyl hydrolase [Tritrichomonas foetus]|uniref:beta-glucosidase n=1 Tax=Tritrichomonas foetus TaxID=1144522 RepID=A0A1J4J858_9EUKA|nr:glycosyl hydrolase [Tritrichomonas foetus]|eukprot:OHS93867.1 glycosyl hydrolase [Tritrichomonas foetus]